MISFSQPDDTRPKRRRPHVFYAQYPGACACGEDIKPGDAVYYDKDDDLVGVLCCDYPDD